MNPRLQYCLATAILCVLGSSAAHAQGSTTVPTLRKGQAVDARLGQSSARDDGTPYALYNYRGTPGEYIQIDMSSDDFDTLIVTGENSTGSGCNSCRRNDDGGGGTNSRLRQFVPESGQLQIRATAIGEGMGRYRLQLQALPPPPPVTPRALALGSPVSARLGNDSSVDEEGRPFQLWTLQGQPGQNLVLRMESSDLDALLQYGQWQNGRFTSEAEDDDGGRDTNARLRVQLDAQGRGALKAMSFNAEGSGSYTISASVPPAPRPPSVVDINIGDSVRGELDEGDQFDEEGENYFDVYRIRGRAGQRVTVQLNSDSFDSVLRWGVFDGAAFIKDAEDDDGGGGTNSRLTVTLDKDGQGRIVVSGLGEGTGSYTLSVVNAARGSR